MTTESENRRPIASRDTGWAKKAALTLARWNFSPNAISLLSIVFAAFSLLFFYLDHHLQGIHALNMILAIAAIQGRLLMNMLDGMVAIEYNKKSALGALYNEMPDRISDTLTLFGAGLIIRQMPYGTDLTYLAIALAVTTAYIRTLGGAVDCSQTFAGPMAKPHRMALTCVGCIVAIWYPPVFYYLFILMNLGLLITCYRRLSKIATCLIAKTKA